MFGDGEAGREIPLDLHPGKMDLVGLIEGLREARYLNTVPSDVERSAGIRTGG